tara:strand:- start:454 stop:846 length:393 start_codon:yes stop_codon:yes gene_type:complete
MHSFAECGLVDFICERCIIYPELHEMRRQTLPTLTRSTLTLPSFGTQVCLIALLSIDNFPDSSSIQNAVQSYQQPSQSTTTTPTPTIDTKCIRASEGRQPAQYPETQLPSPGDELGSTTTTNTTAGIHGK